jgi:hypothetical protein
MPTSIFLAKLIGPICLVIGVGVLVNAKVYRALADEFLRSYALLYLSGVLAITAGLAVVLTHNVWVADWRIIITLLGWLAVIGGAVRIVRPQLSEAFGRSALRQRMAVTAAGVVWTALGALLCYFGYVR